MKIRKGAPFTPAISLVMGVVCCLMTSSVEGRPSGKDDGGKSALRRDTSTPDRAQRPQEPQRASQLLGRRVHRRGTEIAEEKALGR